MPSPLAISESLAILASGLFAGAALYVSFVKRHASLAVHHRNPRRNRRLATRRAK